MTPTEADPILDLIPAGYKGIALAILILTPILGRAYHALKTNGGLKGIWNSIIFGTNTPKLLIGLLCVCSITSCGLTREQWFQIGKAAALREAPLIYGDVQAAKAKTAAKNTVNVNP